MKRCATIEKALIFLGLCFCVIGVVITGEVGAEVKTWSVGGEEYPWAELGMLTAFDDATSLGAIQPIQFHPDENIVLCDKMPGNIYINRILGKRCYFQAAPPDPFFKKGENPRSWYTTTGYYSEGYRLVDGNVQSMFVRTNPNYLHFLGDFYTIDTGVTVPANRVVFYPPQEGIDAMGVPFAERYIRGYELSMCVTEPEFFRGERTYHILEQTLARVPQNFDSVTEVKFPLQTLRFLRLLNTGDSPHIIAELELYGEGFAPLTTYVSEIIDLGKPVNLGKLNWQMTRLKAVTEVLPAVTEKGKLIPIEYKEIDGEMIPTITENGTEVILKIERGVVVEKRKNGTTEKTSIELFEVHRVVDVIPDADAPVWMEVETRSGRDDSPLVYHMINDMGGETVIRGQNREEMERKYEELLEAPQYYWQPIRPGMRGSITYDTENWSSWSVPYLESGEQIRSPGPRRYFQFRITLRSDSFWHFGRIDSLSFEHSPVLADTVLGEISVLGDPNPPEGVAEVFAGHPTTFTYDVRAVFVRGSRGGFDALKVAMPSDVAFNKLEMGSPLVPVTPASVDTSDSKVLTVYLPHKVTRIKNDPIRLTFETTVLTHTTYFIGQVFDTEGVDLPQDIEAGNASDEVSTDKLDVLASGRSLEKSLASVAISPNPITPNGDGQNDQATISYVLLRLTGEAQVDIGIYDLSGSEVWGMSSKKQTGRYTEVWNGSNNDGGLVPPGVYICKVSADTDAGAFEEVQTIAVVY